MNGSLTQIITAADEATRNRSLDAFCASASLRELLRAGQELEAFRHARENLYERVRACFFLSAIHRFHTSTDTFARFAAPPNVSHPGGGKFSAAARISSRTRSTSAIG